MPHLSTPVVPSQVSNQELTNLQTEVIPDKTEFKLIKKIGESRSPVYLATSEVHNSKYAFKTFSCKNKSQPSP